MSEDLKTRLSRWSQRKLAARRGAVTDEAPASQAQPPDREQAESTQDKNTQEANSNVSAPIETEDEPVLPSIEELTADSDYTVFLGKKVPEALKTAALRKLWRSDPVFANLDGLNDYCEDLNIVDTPITLAQTSYKVGKGFLDEMEDKLAKLEPAQSEMSRAGPAESSLHKDAGQLAHNENVPGDNADPALRQPEAEEQADHPDAQGKNKDGSAE
jgi:hypothetical protein